jgi:hypothetical protein
VQGIDGPQGAAGASHPKQLRIGMASIVPGANANTAGTRVTFSAAFRVNVNVVCSMRTSVPGDPGALGETDGGGYVNCSANNIGLDGFDPYVYRTNTTTCLVDWFAVGDR